MNMNGKAAVSPASFTLKNDNGIEVTIISAGASIRRLIVPDFYGKKENIVLSFKDEKLYFNNPLYAGAILGPVAGRISDGRLPLCGTAFQLTRNDGANHLHGGKNSLSFLNWQLQSQGQNPDTGESVLVFQASLPDGTDGFPGNRHFTASYSLNRENQLTLVYEAVSDKDTYFNLSNHSYFNLSGDFTESALNQELLIDAEQYVANNEEHLPIGFEPVGHTPFDFRTPHTLAAHMEAYPKHPQLLNALGYNNGFALSTPKATLFHKKSGRCMELTTNAPCIVLYSGGYIPKGLPLADSFFSSPSCAIALEAQDFPNAPNCPAFAFSFTKAHEVYRCLIQYRFFIAKPQE